VTERHIACYDPVSVVSIGISGGVHEDLRVGDVFVPPQTVQYMQDGKTTQKKRGGYVIVPGPPSREVDHQLLTAATGFRLKHKEAHARWQKDASTNLTALVAKADRDKLFASDLVRKKAVVRTDGHAATGPVVVGSTAFCGISDYGDPRKKELDAIGKGGLRKYAMRNAVRFLFALLEQGALPVRPR
jgi:nucleoside phosphorylase